jgi:hypothetical protein
MRIRGACGRSQARHKNFVIRVIPRRKAHQNLCQTLDLCTKPGLLVSALDAFCYKSHGAPKYLIHNTFPSRLFCGYSSPSLDFSGPGSATPLAINKVIHTILESSPKLFQIKDLSAVCENRLKFIG